MNRPTVFTRAAFEAGAQRTRNRERSRPTLPTGSLVWRGTEVYVAELVEQHGLAWVAGVVPVSDASKPIARMCFIPVRDLDWAH